MKNYTIKRYQESDYDNWNTFVSQAKNATFLFHRDFMEYHKDRFQDFSLMVFEGKKLVAILPANQVGEKLYSHQGLTYGGLVLLPNSKFYNTIFVFQTVLKYLHDIGISALYLKQIPSIYCDYPSDEINYLMYVCQGKLKMKHNISVVDLNRKSHISKSRKQCVRGGQQLGFTIKEETNLESFWNTLLIPNLREKYDSKPVHTVVEITQLQKRFPKNIRHFNVYQQEELVCGTTLFVTDNVVKPQYISGSEKDIAGGSIDFLYDYLINEIAKGKPFFDFGPSHEENGLRIVKNVNFWKESFGAHSLVQDFYEVETANYKLLEKVLI